MSTFLQILNYKEHYQNTAKILQIFFSLNDILEPWTQYQLLLKLIWAKL